MMGMMPTIFKDLEPIVFKAVRKPLRRLYRRHNILSSPHRHNRARNLIEPFPQFINAVKDISITINEASEHFEKGGHPPRRPQLRGSTVNYTARGAGFGDPGGAEVPPVPNRDGEVEHCGCGGGEGGHAREVVCGGGEAGGGCEDEFADGGGMGLGEREGDAAAHGPAVDVGAGKGEVCDEGCEVREHFFGGVGGRGRRVGRAAAEEVWRVDGVGEGEGGYCREPGVGAGRDAVEEY